MVMSFIPGQDISHFDSDAIATLMSIPEIDSEGFVQQVKKRQFLRGVRHCYSRLSVLLISSLVTY